MPGATAPLQPLQHTVAQTAVGNLPSPSAAADLQPVHPSLYPDEGVSAAASPQPMQLEGGSGAAGAVQLMQYVDQPASKKRRRDALGTADDEKGPKRVHIQAYAGTRPAWK